MGDFAPFLVAYNSQTLGNGRYSDNLGSAAISGIPGQPFGGDWSSFNTGQSNHYGMAILGNHTIIPDKLKLNYGIGYFRLAKPTFVWVQDANGDWNANAFTGINNTAPIRHQSKDLGWEIDFGVTFNIFENVWLETEFGYFFNGSAFERWNDVTQTWVDPKDTFAWATVLAFEF
jgi:hypothetical protein